jgi:hypothetical protein
MEEGTCCQQLLNVYCFVTNRTQPLGSGRVEVGIQKY